MILQAFTWTVHCARKLRSAPPLFYSCQSLTRREGDGRFRSLNNRTLPVITGYDFHMSGTILRDLTRASGPPRAMISTQHVEVFCSRLCRVLTTERLGIMQRSVNNSQSIMFVSASVSTPPLSRTLLILGHSNYRLNTFGFVSLCYAG